MAIVRNYNELGSFTNESGTLRVTDPTTPKNHWAAQTFPAIPGNWHAANCVRYIPQWGTRSGLIAIKHESVPSFKLFDDVYLNKDHIHYRAGWEVLSKDVFADCAMIGFFDNDYFGLTNPVAGHPVDIIRPEDTFEDECANLTMSKQLGGVMTYGAVSRSGIGDGFYACIIHRNNKQQIDAACVLFL